MSVFVKYITIALVPVFMVYYLRNVKDTKTFLKSGALFALTSCLVFLPYLSAGINIFKQFVLYTRYWQFNGFIYKGLSLVFLNYGRIISFCIMIAALYSIYRSFKLSVEQKILYVLMSILLLSPVMYPWYLIWIVPFLVFTSIRSFYIMPMLVFVSYEILVDYAVSKIWSESIIILLIQYIPFFIILIYDLTRGFYVQRKKDICHYTGP